MSVLTIVWWCILSRLPVQVTGQWTKCPIARTFIECQSAGSARKPWPVKASLLGMRAWSSQLCQYRTSDLKLGNGHFIMWVVNSKANFHEVLVCSTKSLFDQKSFRPKVVRPKVRRRKVCSSKSLFDKKSVRSKLYRLKFRWPKVCRPKVRRPKVFQPKVVVPKVFRPKILLLMMQPVIK